MNEIHWIYDVIVIAGIAVIVGIVVIIGHCCLVLDTRRNDSDTPWNFCNISIQKIIVLWYTANK